MQPNGHGMRQVARRPIAGQVIASRALFEANPEIMRLMQAASVEHVMMYHMSAVEAIRWEWEMVRAGEPVGQGGPLAPEDMVLLRAHSVQQVEVAGPQLIVPGGV